LPPSTESSSWPDGVYVAALGTPRRHGLDLGLDLYEELARQEPQFWRAFQTRVEVSLTHVFANAPTSGQTGQTLSDAYGPLASSRTARAFRRDGDIWTLQFNGRCIQLRDSKGLRYLAYLLERPHREVAARDLIWAVDGPPAASHLPSLEAVPGVVDVSEDYVLGFGDAGPLADEKTKLQIQRRLEEIEAELAQAHDRGKLNRVEELKNEYDELRDYLAGAYGLGGRSRVAASASERARTSVAQAIRRARQQIVKHHPELAEHLLHVKTARLCIYDPPAHAAAAWEI
jgi:hypothetical protein